MKSQVLLITSIFPPQIGGPAIFSFRFNNWLMDNEMSTNVVSYANRASKNSTNIHLISLETNRLKAFFKFVFAVKKYSNKRTLILSNGAFIETYLACLFTRRTYVVKLPGDQVWEFSKNRKWTSSDIENFQSEKLNFFQFILRILFNLSFKNAKSVIVPSQQLANFAKGWGVDKNRIKLIYNSVDSSQFKRSNTEVIKYDVVTVCRLVPWKGLEELIYCALELNLKLAIIGDGPLIDQLKSIALKPLSRIEFMGSLENHRIAEVLNSSKLFVLNSEYEATSYSLIEAKMCGLPVIAKKNDGNATVVQDNIDGFVINHNSFEELKSSINRLLVDEKLRKTFGEQSRIDALNRFDQESNFRKIFNEFKSDTLKIKQS